MAQPKNHFIAYHRGRALLRKSRAWKATLFEIKSLNGRWFFRNRAPLGRYLHVGCGQNVLPDFTNLDFYSHRARDHVFGHDLRYPLPFTDGRFAGAFSEHTLEHLSPGDAFNLLKEIHRVLRPGAIFRCAVPDLGLYVQFYNGERVPGFEMFRSGAEAIAYLTQEHGHLSVWDEVQLACKLTDAGFTRAARRRFRTGANPDLLQDQTAREFETLYMEAVR